MEKQIQDIILERICWITERTYTEIAGHDLDFLTGEYWGLTAYNMVYLKCELEKIFQIHIEIKDLQNYAFATIDGITKIIKEKCNLAK